MDTDEIFISIKDKLSDIDSDTDDISHKQFRKVLI